jgi:hypothetical protein
MSEVYLVMRTEEWEDSDIMEAFEDKEDAKEYRDLLTSKLDEDDRSNYHVEPLKILRGRKVRANIPWLYSIQ